MKALKEAYIGYHATDSVTGIKIKSLKNVNPANAYQVDYVRYIANAFNFVLGRFAYFSDRFNRAESEIIVTDKDLSKSIGCNIKHSSIVLSQLKDLFNLNYERKKHRGGARVIKINQAVIDFLNVYNDDDLTIFMKENGIEDSELTYALSQLYRYRVWGITDSKLSLTERKKRDEYLNDRKDYLHRVTSSSRSDYARIKLIESNQGKLSESELEQFKAIKLEKMESSRLKHYWYMVLIKLEQKISALIRLIDQPKEETSNKTTIDGNTEPIKDVARASATQKAQRIPESPDVHGHTLAPRDYLVFLATWNNMIKEQKIPEVKTLNTRLIQSIDRLVTKYGKEDVLNTINKVSALEHKKPYPHKITLERFLKDITYEYVRKLETNPDVKIDWFDDYLREEGYEVTREISIDSLPEVNTIQEAINYWSSQF